MALYDDMKPKLRAGHWVWARGPYSASGGEQQPCVYIKRRADEYPDDLTPAEAREVAALLIEAADYAEKR